MGIEPALLRQGGNQPIHPNNLVDEAGAQEMEWTSTLKMAISPAPGMPFEERDIFQLGKNGDVFGLIRNTKYRFDPSVYPRGSINKLFEDLNAKAKMDGYYLIRANTEKGKSFIQNYKFACFRNKKYSPKKETKLRAMQGKNMRKTTTTKPLVAQEICKCSITVNEDSEGYYVHASNVKGDHRCHPRQDFTTPRLKKKDSDLQTTQDAVSDELSFGGGASDISTSFGSWDETNSFALLNPLFQELVLSCENNPSSIPETMRMMQDQITRNNNADALAEPFTQQPSGAARKRKTR